ncbi:MAG: P-II family nitrogen regulator [bacterium]
MKKLEIIIRPGKIEAVRKAMEVAGCVGVTISQAEGHGNQKGLTKERQGSSYRMEMVPKVRLEAVVPDNRVEPIVEAIIREAKTGQPGDGKIFIFDVMDVVRIRTGERGEKAI